MGDLGNRMEDMKGRAKEAAGDLTGDEELEREGKLDQGAAGLRDKADDAIDAVKDKAGDLMDKLDRD